MAPQEPAHLAVEALGPHRLELAEAFPEALGERIIDAIHQLDRKRIDEDRVGAAGLEDAVPERPEQGLGDAGEAGIDALAAVSIFSGLVRRRDVSRVDPGGRERWN